MPINLNSKTYSFIGFDKNGVSVYQETSAGVPTGFGYLTCKIFPAGPKSGARVRWRLTMPVVIAADSPCGCAGQVSRTYQFDEGKVEVPATSTSAERIDFAARISDLVDTTQYQLSLTSLTQPSS